MNTSDERTRVLNLLEDTLLIHFVTYLQTQEQNMASPPNPPAYIPNVMPPPLPLGWTEHIGA